MDAAFENPFRPGAGHRPPYLAGRIEEQSEFRRLLKQTTILENMVLTGLRGVGKTVLLDSLKPMAQSSGWVWIVQDLSEAASVSEDRLAVRILADLSIPISNLISVETSQLEIGFTGGETNSSQPMTFNHLVQYYESIPGLVSDKLKAVLEFVWEKMPDDRISGIIFAYDEAQNLADHSEKEEYPLSLLLDVFQSIQRKGIPFMLVLVGLPTLFPKLVEARTYAERMFHVLFLAQLSDAESHDAIKKPVEDASCPVKFNEDAVENITKLSGGYPYFVQFICREVFDVWIQQLQSDQKPSVPQDQILRKLDVEFFAGRWARATDRQRELLSVIARLPNCDDEFTLQEITRRSDELSKESYLKSFKSSHVGQLLASLAEAGLIYKNRHGKYSFAVPLMAQFIRRQIERNNIVAT